VQVIPTGLLRAIYTLFDLGLIVFPSTTTVSVGLTLVPRVAKIPFTYTLPDSINLSASLLEQIPLSLMYLLSLSKFLLSI